MRRILRCMMLKIAAMPITTTMPYQKYLAKAFPSTWNSVSSRIWAKISIACVSFEKSTPVSFKAMVPMAGMSVCIFVVGVKIEVRV